MHVYSRSRLYPFVLPIWLSGLILRLTGGSGETSGARRCSVSLCGLADVACLSAERDLLLRPWRPLMPPLKHPCRRVVPGDSSARPSAALASLSTNTGTSALCDSDTLESLTRSPTLRDPPGFPKLGRHRNYYSSLLLPQNSAPQVCMYACMHGASSLPTRQRATCRPPSAVIANYVLDGQDVHRGHDGTLFDVWGSRWSKLLRSPFWQI